MTFIYSLIIFLIFIIAVVIERYLTARRVAKMTKDKLLEKCKALIDKGEYSKMQRVLLSHPKLLLQHFNELQMVLTDYASYVESLENIKKGV